MTTPATSTPSAYSVVIPTKDRPHFLAETLETLQQQDPLPEQIIVVDASSDGRTRTLCEACNAVPKVVWIHADKASAACQRNQGAHRVDTKLVAFVDDDVTVPSDHFAKLMYPFDTPPFQSPIAGTAGRMGQSTHPIPRRALRMYYRMQSGYPHPHYGGKLFAPGINTFPCFAADREAYIPVEWLNSACVMYRTDFFLAELFPPFKGYSTFEDVHLSARMARHGQLLVVADAPYDHREGAATGTPDYVALSRMYMRNQRRVAREVLHLHPIQIYFKQLLHRMFVSIAIVRQPPKRARIQRLWGTWSG